MYTYERYACSTDGLVWKSLMSLSIQPCCISQQDVFSLLVFLSLLSGVSASIINSLGVFGVYAGRILHLVTTKRLPSKLQGLTLMLETLWSPPLPAKSSFARFHNTLSASLHCPSIRFPMNSSISSWSGNTSKRVLGLRNDVQLLELVYRSASLCSHRKKPLPPSCLPGEGTAICLLHVVMLLDRRWSPLQIMNPRNNQCNYSDKTWWQHKLNPRKLYHHQ